MTSKALCTFPGTNGDILWAMPTVKAISEMIGEKVDFACMPHCESLLSLIRLQPYIAEAYIIKEWILAHSNFGDQPWLPPGQSFAGYERVWHLGYREHPGFAYAGKYALVDFVAHQQGLKLKNPIPFLQVPEAANRRSYIAVAFNPQYAPEKALFLQSVKEKFPYDYLDVTKEPWVHATALIREADAMLCCRSSNYVIGHGVGQERMFVYDPHPARHSQGMMGGTFGCPYNREVLAPLAMSPLAAADMAVGYLTTWSGSMRKGEVEYENA